MLTPEREVEIRAAAADGDCADCREYRSDTQGDLLAEIDRLRAELDAAHDRVPAELGWDGATTEAQRLRAELEKAEKELRTLRPYKPWPDPLQAENEALREAGEMMYEEIKDYDVFTPGQVAWRKAVGER